MSNLLQKASIVTTPTAYGVGVLNSIKPAFSVSDTELVTNGDFSNGLTGWTGSTPPTQNPDNSLTFDSPSENMFQSISRIVGRKYRITFDGTGSLRYRTGYASPDNAVRQVTLPAVVDIVANATTNRIQPYGPSSGTTILKSISLREITDADFQFSRTSSATRVNPDYLIETVSINSANLVQNGNFSELGSELVTNGDFETDSNWTKGTGWSISNGKAVSNSSTSSIYQATGSNYTSGKTYKIVFTVSDYVSGSVRPEITNVIGSNVSSNGTFTQYIVATSSPIGEELKAVNFIGSIDNVSVKQVDPNDNWRLFNGATITDNKANIIGDGSAFGYIEQLNTFTSGKKYKITLDAVINSGGGLVVKYAIGFSANIGSITTSGSYTFSYTAGVTGSIIIGRKTSGTAYDSSITNISVIEIQENGVPRLDYTNGTASILLEPQSTNLYSNSNYNASTWTASNIDSVTSNYAISPDGTQNAFRVVMSSSGSLIYSGGTGSSGTNTVSVYAKSNTNTEQKFRFFGNGVTSVSADMTVNQEWQRFEFSAAFSFVTWGLKGASVSATNDILFFGFQHEVQSFSTSLIPTSGSTVTRAAEVANNAGSSDLINSEEGVLYAEIAALANPTSQEVALCVSEGQTGANRLLIRLKTNGAIGIVLRVANNTQATIDSSSLDQSINHKVAVKWKVNDVALWIDGTQVGTDTSANVFSANTLNEVAFNQGNNSNQFYGKCKTVAVFKEELSDTELACLTSTNNREIFLNYYYRMQYVGANTEALSCAEQTFNV